MRSCPEIGHARTRTPRGFAKSRFPTPHRVECTLIGCAGAFRRPCKASGPGSPSLSRRRWSGCGMASFVAPRASALTRRLRAPVGTATTIRELPESSRNSAKRRRSVSGDPPTAKQQPQRGRVVGVVHVAVEGLAGALQPLAQRVAVDSECPGSLLPLATVHGEVRTLRKVDDAGPQVQPSLESASVRSRLSSSPRADGTHSPYRRGGRQRWADGTQRRRLQPLGHLHRPPDEFDLYYWKR